MELPGKMVFNGRLAMTDSGIKTEIKQRTRLSVKMVNQELTASRVLMVSRELVHQEKTAILMYRVKTDIGTLMK